MAISTATIQPPGEPVYRSILLSIAAATAVPAALALTVAILAAVLTPQASAERATPAAPVVARSEPSTVPAVPSAMRRSPSVRGAAVPQELSEWDRR